MESIKKYFPDLTPQQIECLTHMENLYHYWNARINLISRKTIEAFYQQHVLHALGIAKILQFLPGTHIMDVGTGGGFPGVPLAIAFPECQFFLIDSIIKKIKAVRVIIQELGLNNVEIRCVRAEDINEKFDFITNRSVTQMPQFYSWVKNKLRLESQHQLRNGILSLKGGDLTEELKNFPQAIEFSLKNHFKESFFKSKKVIYLPTSIS
ncbi:MAG: 16S rRNA (guanine(527)-N(7))-methyltransferase RsmG [Flavobacteriales bacterium Tduv]